MKSILLLLAIVCLVQTGRCQVLVPEQYGSQVIHSLPSGNLNNLQTPENTLSVINLLAGTGTSANARAPQGSQRYIKTVYLITAAELATAGVPAGIIPNTMGFNYSTAQSPATTSTTFKMYLQNTTDVTYSIASSLWTDVIAPMTLVHNANVTIPAATGNWDIPLSGGSPFTYTGGGLYIAYEYTNASNALATTSNVANCNTDLASGLRNNFSTTVNPTNVTNVSSFRPVTRMGFALANDAAVSEVYTLGKLPIPYATPHAIAASIRNNGDNAQTNLVVTVNVSGANIFTDTKTIPSLASGASATVTFNNFSPTVAGTNTIVVSLPSDDVPANNTKTISQIISNNAYTYAYGTTASGGVGFTGSTGDFVAKFVTNTPTTINQVSVNFAVGGQPFNIGIWDKSGTGKPGTLLYASPGQTSTTGVFTLAVSPPIAVTDTFYVGVKQTGTTNVSFAFQNENPIRPNTFFYTSPTGSATWTDFAPGSPYKFMIEPRLTLANDVGPSSITNPLGGSTVRVCGAIAPKALIANFGASNQNFNATFEIRQGASLVYTSTKPLSLNSGVSQTVIFDSTFSPVTGPYTARVYTTLAGDGDNTNDTVKISFTAAVLDYGGGSVANGGYLFANSTSCASPSPFVPTYNWITEQSNTINWGANGDDSVWTQPINTGFYTPYFDSAFAQLWVCSNGWISFTNSTAISPAVQRTPVAIPTAGGIENYIAGALTDFDLTSATYPDAFVYYGGNANRYVITFWHAHIFGSATDYITFQIILKPDGNIYIQYNDAQSTVPVPVSIINNCAVGIENINGTKGIQYRLNGAGGPMFGSPLALQFKPAAASSNYNLCPGGSTSLVSSITGTTYQWQVNTGSGFVNVSDNANYSGSNTSTLQVINPPGSWYGYQYRCVVDGNNSATVVIKFVTTFTGAVSSAWEIPANWNCGVVPDANTDVIINAGIVIVNSNQSCRSLTTKGTSGVTVNTGFTLNITH